MRQHNSIGVDVSDTSIKVLLLDAHNDVIAYGTRNLEKGVVEKGYIVDKTAFADELSLVLKNTKPIVLDEARSNLRAIVSMPESKLFTYMLSIPETIAKNDVDQFVRENAEKIIPYDFESLYFDYHVSIAQGKRHAVFVGVPKQELDNFVDAFSQAGVKPLFVGGELFSLGRALLPQDVQGAGSIILDMGSHATTIGIFFDDAIANASIVIPEGGDKFTEAIAQTMSIPIEEAEELKRKYGLSGTDTKGIEVKDALEPCLQQIVGSVLQARDFFEKKRSTKITSVIVAGGSALMPGICEFLEAKTGLSTQQANPLSHLKDGLVFKGETPSVLFANVIGLALCGAKNDLPKINLLTQYRYVEGGGEKQLLKLQDIRSLADATYVAYGLVQIVKDGFSSVSTFIRSKIKIKLALVGSLLFLVCTLAFLAWVIIKYL